MVLSHPPTSRQRLQKQTGSSIYEQMSLHPQMKSLLPMLLLGLTLGCAPKKSEQDVWSLYDIRHRVPANSSVPVSRASQYDPYRDNDDYYVAPSFGSCGSTNIGLGGCE